MVDKTDPAYPFVEEANRKERANRAARDKPKQPSPLLNAGVMLLLWNVAYINWIDGNKGFAVFFLVISSVNGYTAYKHGWKQKR